MRIKQRDQIWLAVMGIMSAIVTFAPDTANSLRVGAVFAFIVAMTLVFAQPALNRMRGRVTNTVRKPQGTQAAQEAVQRARARGETPLIDLELADIGLFASETTSDGVTFRRTREVSHADDGVRPYIHLKAGTLNAERSSLIRYEMIDPVGNTAFVHEQKAYLQYGDNTLHPDVHLPLAGVLASNQLGRWDLHTYIDGRLVGMLTFTISPTDDERRSRLSGRQQGAATFEELLRRGSAKDDYR